MIRPSVARFLTQQQPRALPFPTWKHPIHYQRLQHFDLQANPSLISLNALSSIAFHPDDWATAAACRPPQLPLRAFFSHLMSRFLGRRLVQLTLAPGVDQHVKTPVGLVTVNWEQQWLQGAMQAYWLWLQLIDSPWTLAEDEQEEQEEDDAEEEESAKEPWMWSVPKSRVPCPFLKSAQSAFSDPASSVDTAASKEENDEDLVTVDLSHLFHLDVLHLKPNYPPMQQGNPPTRITAMQNPRIHDLRFTLKLNPVSPNAPKSLLELAEQAPDRRQCMTLFNHLICVEPSDSALRKQSPNADFLQLEMDVWMDLEYSMIDAPDRKFKRVASITMQSNDMIVEKDSSESSQLRWKVKDLDQQLRVQQAMRLASSSE